METKRTCQHCGKTLGPEAIEGLCPECLMKMGLGIGTEASGTATQDKRSFVPPSIAELGPKFPQFEIVALIGHGGMGAVYKARQKQLERVVALKILPPGVGEDLGFADRFAREAKAMAKLNHPGIVTIHDFGCANGLYYLVMEFVDGVSLGQLMRTGRVSSREALAIVPQICDALQYAHDQGIVHRDIKPENILLDRQGRVKVADFGLAKLVGTLDEPQAKGATVEAAALTQAGKTMGTPSYMAPEQVGDPGAVDHRADIYALGVVFYQMLTGELPSKPIEAPSRKVRIDVRLDDVVLCALEKAPERRYQQVSDIKTAVETIAQASTPDRTKNAVRGVKGRVLAAIVGLLVIGLLSFMLLRTRRAHQAEIEARSAEMKIRLTNIREGQKVRFNIVPIPQQAFGSQADKTQPTQTPDWVKIKPLADWITDLSNSDPKIQRLAGEAIAVMGTNALPEFLKILTEKEPTAEARDRHYKTAEALRFLGPELKSAIPTFTALLKSGDEETAYSGATALAFSTSVASEAWASLTNALVDPQDRGRDAATHGVSLLFNLDSTSTRLAEPALPIVVNNLKDHVDYVRADSALALYLYAYRQHLENRDAKPGMIIPPLTTLLRDGYSWSRIHAAMALGEYRTNANSVVPRLSKLLDDADPQVRSAATNALKLITSPENHLAVVPATNGNLPENQKEGLNTGEALSQTETGFYFVAGGGVAVPGRHVFQPGLTAMAAIKASGGFTLGALKTKAELTRAGSQAPSLIDLAAIEKGNAPDPTLTPGDKLWIPASPPTGP